MKSSTAPTVPPGTQWLILSIGKAPSLRRKSDVRLELSKVLSILACHGMTKVVRSSWSYYAVQWRISQREGVTAVSQVCFTRSGNHSFPGQLLAPQRFRLWLNITLGTFGYVRLTSKGKCLPEGITFASPTAAGRWVAVKLTSHLWHIAKTTFLRTINCLGQNDKLSALRT